MSARSNLAPPPVICDSRPPTSALPLPTDTVDCGLTLTLLTPPYSTFLLNSPSLA